MYMIQKRENELKRRRNLALDGKSYELFVKFSKKVLIFSLNCSKISLEIGT